MAVDAEYWQWVNAEWNAGRLTRPGAALQKLRAHPRTFLKQYPIQSNYDAPVDGAACVYVFNGAGGQRPGAVLKTRRMHDTESFTIQPNPGKSGEGHPFWCHGLHMGASSAAPVWYLLDDAGPDIMLTGKLTGCTFIARAVAGHPGRVEVTHLQPHLETGIALNTRMDAVPGQLTYGRLKYDFDVRSINVIGVRVGGSWKIYAQKVEKQTLTIRSVQRIFPPE